MHKIILILPEENKTYLLGTYTNCDIGEILPLVLAWRKKIIKSGIIKKQFRVRSLKKDGKYWLSSGIPPEYCFHEDDINNMDIFKGEVK